MESKNLDRGTQLFEMGRYENAESFFHKTLQEDPHNWNAKFYLALCYFNTEKYNEANKLSDALLSENPNEPHVFYLKSKIAAEKEDFNNAHKFIDEAISLFPNDADFFGQKAAVFMSEKQYSLSLEYADKGLQINPKNQFCLNLRAQALTKLKRKVEASETVENILYDDPENAMSQTNVGWVALENGDHKKALNHFKEALKLDPNNDYARNGMSTALKARNIVYKWYLKYAFWISNKSDKNQWFFIIGIYLVYRFAVKALSATGMTFLTVPIIVAYLVFALGGWIMEPLSNMILNFDKYGKYLLDNDEKYSGLSFFFLLIWATIAAIAFFVLKSDYFMVLTVAGLCALLPIPRAFLQYSRNARIFGLAYGGIMLLLGVFGFLFIESSFTNGLVIGGMLILFTWIGNAIK
ncbi:tetratricopeptide repeat protein [Leptobacterium flavescens]|uniref:Tetratricopeptide repeat protein n=1 Tax=Leptobacterium flavescens TaxID=472055 RepID=A0A6P0ULX4_9FLAO|nr:tetratricopeptide repeat protein [Leptobacterium flavescens]NER13430.1 tetratricopeptide repeat protein [Leptobacterium flavescens]